MLRATVTALVTDLLADMADQSLPRTRTGSVRDDLRTSASLVRQALADPRQCALFRALIAAAACDDRPAEALRHFHDAATERAAVTAAKAGGSVTPA